MSQLETQPSAPHDGLVKWSFGQPALAAEYWRALLPQQLSKDIDWTSLRAEPGSYIDDGLRSLHTDLLFSAAFAGSAERVLLYLLLEHQSSVDRLMAARLHSYAGQIIARWLRRSKSAPEAAGAASHEARSPQSGSPHSVTQSGADGGNECDVQRGPPAIVPLVLYHGDRPWSAPMELLDLYELPVGMPESWHPYLPRLRYIVDDLTQIGDGSLRQRAMSAVARLVLMALKRSRDDDARQMIVENLSLIREVRATSGGAEALQVVLTYMLSVTKSMPSEGWLKELAPALGDQFSYIKEEMMTAADKLRQQGMKRGMKRGMERGLEQGIEQGIERGRAEALWRLVRAKFGTVPAGVEEKIHSIHDDELDAWMERLLSASTLEDVFSPG